MSGLVFCGKEFVGARNHAELGRRSLMFFGSSKFFPHVRRSKRKSPEGCHGSLNYVRYSKGNSDFVLVCLDLVAFLHFAHTTSHIVSFPNCVKSPGPLLFLPRIFLSRGLNVYIFNVCDLSHQLRSSSISLHLRMLTFVYHCVLDHYLGPTTST